MNKILKCLMLGLLVRAGFSFGAIKPDSLKGVTALLRVKPLAGEQSASNSLKCPWARWFLDQCNLVVLDSEGNCSVIQSNEEVRVCHEEEAEVINDLAINWVPVYQDIENIKNDQVAINWRPVLNIKNDQVAINWKPVYQDTEKTKLLVALGTGSGPIVVKPMQLS